MLVKIRIIELRLGAHLFSLHAGGLSCSISGFVYQRRHVENVFGDMPVCYGLSNNNRAGTLVIYPILGPAIRDKKKGVLTFWDRPCNCIFLDPVQQSNILLANPKINKWNTCRAKRQYLFTLQVNRYYLLAQQYWCFLNIATNPWSWRESLEKIPNVREVKRFTMKLTNVCQIWGGVYKIIFRFFL